MTTLTVTSVELVADFDHGEGWVRFQWADPLFGREGLTIDLDGHCSRNMPIRSGDGLPEFVEIGADRIRLKFDSKLAKRLELDEDILIVYSFSEWQLHTLQKLVQYFNGDADC